MQVGDKVKVLCSSINQGKQGVVVSQDYFGGTIFRVKCEGSMLPFWYKEHELAIWQGDNGIKQPQPITQEG